MRPRLFTAMLLIALASGAVAQTTALPGNRSKMGGTDSTSRIQREVMHELLMLPYYSVFDNLAFPLRSPLRPNPIGTSLVTLAGVEEGALLVRGLDCFDGTPLIDIKPDRCPFTPLALQTPDQDR